MGGDRKHQTGIGSGDIPGDGKFAPPLAQPYVDYAMAKGLNTVLGPDVRSLPQLMPLLPVIFLLAGIVSLLGLRPRWHRAKLGEWTRPSLYLGLLLFFGTFVIAATMLLPGVEENPVLVGAIMNTAAMACVFGVFLLIASLVCWFAKRVAK